MLADSGVILDKGHPVDPVLFQLGVFFPLFVLEDGVAVGFKAGVVVFQPDPDIDGAVLIVPAAVFTGGGVHQQGDQLFGVAGGVGVDIDRSIGIGFGVRRGVGTAALRRGFGRGGFFAGGRGFRGRRVFRDFGSFAGGGGAGVFRDGGGFFGRGTRLSGAALFGRGFIGRGIRRSAFFLSSLFRFYFRFIIGFDRFKIFAVVQPLDQVRDPFFDDFQFVAFQRVAFVVGAVDVKDVDMGVLLVKEVPQLLFGDLPFCRPSP